MYQAVLPYNLIEGFNKVENFYDGNLLVLVIMLLCESHFNIFGYLLEDFICGGDLKFIGPSLLSNFYFPYGFSTLAILYM